MRTTASVELVPKKFRLHRRGASALAHEHLDTSPLVGEDARRRGIARCHVHVPPLIAQPGAAHDVVRLIAAITRARSVEWNAPASGRWSRAMKQSSARFASLVTTSAIWSDGGSPARQLAPPHLRTNGRFPLRGLKRGVERLEPLLHVLQLIPHFRHFVEE